MQDFELNRRDLLRLAPNAGGMFGGFTAYGITFDMQENLYGRPNIYAPLVDKIQKFSGLKPDFMTSFTAPLALMQAVQLFCAMGQIQSEKFGNRGRENFFRVAKYAAPIAVAIMFAVYEMSGVHANGMEYPDNPGMDNMATLAALGISMATGLISERWGRKKDKKPTEFSGEA